jgi:hypothetical protein
MLYCPIKHKDIWRTRYNNELHTLCYELDIVQVLQVGSLRWLGQLFGMQEMDSCRKITLLKPEGTRRVGNPRVG